MGLDKFASIFIKPADEPKQASQKQAAPQETVLPAKPTQPTTVTTEQPCATVETNDEIERSLWVVLNEKNVPGPDYMELMDNASKLTNLPDMASRLVTTFNFMGSASGNITKQHVLETIDTYVGYVEEERQVGKEAAAKKREKVIGVRNEEIQKLQDRSAAIQAQIEALKKDQADAQAKVLTLQAEVAQATIDIDKEEMVFNNTVNKVVSKLQSDKALIASLAV